MIVSVMWCLGLDDVVLGRVIPMRRARVRLLERRRCRSGSRVLRAAGCLRPQVSALACHVSGAVRGMAEWSVTP